MLALIALLLINSFQIAHAADDDHPLSSKAYMYRFHKPSGEKVVGFQVPAESIKYGYEVLNKKLRVIRVVDPAPTEEELSLIKEKKMALCTRRSALTLPARRVTVRLPAMKARTSRP